MSVSLKGLPPEDRDEWEELVEAALNGSRRADQAAVDRAAKALLRAEGQGRNWPAILKERMVRDALRSALLSRAKAQAMVLVDYHGRPVAKTSRRGVLTRLPDGTREYQQEIWEHMTWDQFSAWSEMNESQISGLLVNRAAASKLAALRALAPQSTGPGDAARLLGTSLEVVLAS